MESKKPCEGDLRGFR